MPPILIEIVLAANALQAAGLEGRDEIEDALDDALSESELGEVVGGGGGERGYNIDVELRRADSVDSALGIIRGTLRELNLPDSTIIRVHNGGTQEHDL